MVSATVPIGLLFGSSEVVMIESAHVDLAAGAVSAPSWLRKSLPSIDRSSRKMGPAK